MDTLFDRFFNLSTSREDTPTIFFFKCKLLRKMAALEDDEMKTTGRSNKTGAVVVSDDNDEAFATP